MRGRLLGVVGACTGYLASVLDGSACRCSADDATKYRLQVVTVATEKTDGYWRFMDSAERFNLTVKVSERRMETHAWS